MKHAPAQARSARLATRAYASVGIETQVLGASPEQLIVMLFEGARAAILKARLHMQNGDVQNRGMAISRAIDIVDTGLKASVDARSGGEVATSLVTVYELVIRNLLLANLNGDISKLDLAECMLADIGQAWRSAACTAGRTC